MLDAMPVDKSLPADKPSGRSSPRLHTQPSSGNPPNTPISITDSQLKQLVVEIKNQNDVIIQNQQKHFELLEKNTLDINELKNENQHLKRRLDLLDEQFVRMDQYSRKSVMIVTGMKLEDSETQYELENKILGMLKSISGTNFSMADFAAIHRNGRFYKNSRPPSITVKFLRYFDKDGLFNRRAISTRKAKFPGIAFHHGMCPGLIAVQSQLTDHSRVKFVIYEGANRHFTICIKGPSGGSDSFMNRVQSLSQFEAKLREI